MFYLHDEPGRIRFALVERLDTAEIHELEASWRTAASIQRSRSLVIDVTRLFSRDESTRELLDRFSAQGATVLETTGATQPAPSGRLRRYLRRHPI